MRLLNFDGHAWWDSPGDSSTSVCAIPIVLSEDMSNVRRAGGATGGAQRFACRDRVVCLNDSVIDRFQCRSTKLSHAQLVRSPCTGGTRTAHSATARAHPGKRYISPHTFLTHQSSHFTVAAVAAAA